MTSSNPNSDVTERNSSDEQVETPKWFGRYEVTGYLGRGGFGAVYKGYDSQLQREVAIKVPVVGRKSPQDIQRYRSEAQNLAKLRHDGIVSVFDVGSGDDDFYIVTELLEGVTLYDWLIAATPTWRESADIVAKAADALAHAHARKVIHRDVKPGNIILTDDRGPVLFDFGLALADHHSGEEIGNVRGTLRYMAPEQIEGLAHRIDGRTDIYALGVILYRMLTGSAPFRSTDKQELRRQILRDEPQPPRQIKPEIPAALERVCYRAMSKTINKRFTTAADMAEKIRAILAAQEDAGTSTRSTPVVEPPESREDGHLSASAGSAAPLAGRRQVTLLSITADVRGTDGETAEFDPEDQIEAIERFQQECQKHIDRFGGSQLPTSSQDLLVCFGYPLSYEDAPRRAVHAGLAIQQALTNISADFASRLQLKLRVWTSIHSGIVIVGGPNAQSLVGDSLKLVTKIDRETQPGDVVVSEATYRLIKHYFHCEDLHSSCGMPGENSLSLLRVVDSISEDEDSSAAEGIQYTPLVGRDQEVSMLQDRWELVGEGFGQLVALIGEAGLGKSRLVQVLKQHVQDTCDTPDPPIVEWTCSPYHTGSAFHPAIEALQKVLKLERAQTDAEKLRRLKDHLETLGIDLAHALPIFCDLLSLPEDPDFPAATVSSQKQKELTLEYLHQWLSALSSQRPILFVVEDLHWVDPSTLDFVHRIADGPINDPYLCVVTFRPEFETPWTSRAHQTQIALNRLTRRQVSQILESKVEAGTVPRGLIDRIADRTDGVPLFVEEYANMLIESADSMFDTVDHFPDSTIGSRSASTAIPATLQGLLMARLDRLGGDPNVVRLAATLGREFTHELIAAASEFPETVLNAELEKLVESQLLFRRGKPPHSSYLFKHALIQDAAYDSMLRRQRRQMHQRIAEAFEKDFPETVKERPELLAHHHTEAGQNLKAAPLWATAGEMATQHGAFVEAVNHLQQGLLTLQSIPASQQSDKLEYQMNVPLGIATLSIKGYAAPELGDIYERRMHLCQELNDPMGQLHANWAMASWRIVRDEIEVSLEIGARMMKMAREMNDAGALMEALFIQGIAQFYHGDFQQSLQSCQQGWELFEPERTLLHTSRTGQHAGVAHLCYMALCHWYLGQPAAALTRMQQALELAESLDHPFSVAFALHHFGWLNTAMRRGAEAVECSDRQIQVSRDQAFFFWETTGMLFRAGGLIWLDREREARAGLIEGLDRYQATGAELAAPQYLGFMASAQLKLGDLDQAAASLDQALAAVEKSAEHFHEPELWRLRAQLADAHGNRDQAIQHAETAVDIARRHDSISWELTVLLDLHGWTDPGPDKHALAERISTLVEQFEPCEAVIPIITQAKSITT